MRGPRAMVQLNIRDPVGHRIGVTEGAGSHTWCPSGLDEPLLPLGWLERNQQLGTVALFGGVEEKNRVFQPSGLWSTLVIFRPLLSPSLLS
jgi:hypothetical protein